MASCTPTKARFDERVQDISLGACNSIDETSILLAYTPVVLQNPDEPDKKPSLQSYQLDLNQTGPMVSRALKNLSPHFLAMMSFLCTLFLGSRCSNQNQERS